MLCLFVKSVMLIFGIYKRIWKSWRFFLLMKCPKCGNKDLIEVKRSLIYRCKKCKFRSHTGSFLEEGESGKPSCVKTFFREEEKMKKKVERIR